MTSPADKPPGRPGFTGKTTGTSAPRFTTDDGRFVDLPPDEPITSLLVNPDGVFVNDDKFLPWQQGPVVSLPSDDTDRCVVCGLATQVRGCTPGACRGGKGFAIVHALIRPGASWYANPGDTINGHPLSAFCESCRLGILEIGRTETAGVELCTPCSEMIGRPPAPASPADKPPGAPPDLCASCTARGVASKLAGKIGFTICTACSEARAAWDAAQPPAAPDHPLPWRWDGPVLRDAESSLMIAGDLGPRSPYVRVVTERAKAMELALGEAMAWLEDPSAYAQKGAPREFDARVHTLLAEIDAAKAGGS